MRSIRQPLTLVSLAAATLVALSAIVFSPTILLAINHLSLAGTGSISSFGQAYSGVSAILSAIALVGIAASLLVQRKQAEIARTQAIRAFQLQMLKICLDRPEVYYPVMGHDIPGSEEEARRQIFGTYFLNYVQAGYSVDFFDEESLMGDVFPRFFKFDIGRSYWDNMRSVWVARYFSKKSRRYIEMLDLSYESAVRSGPPIVAARADDSEAGSMVSNQRSNPTKPSGAETTSSV